MRSMIGNKEAKLVLALMHKKAEVPEDLKAKALEQLRLYSMTCEAGSAKSYLLDQMIEAIESNNIDKVKEIAELSAACLDNENDSEDTSINPETVEIAKHTIDSFVTDMQSKGLPDGAIMAILEKVMKTFNFIPLMYQNEMLAGYSDDHDCILVFGVGFTGDKFELCDKYEKVEQRIDMMRLIAKEFGVEDSIDTQFLAIKYNIIGESDMELIIRGVK